ncbi:MULTISPECIES: hypothetical protein [unclassified Brevibacterium]|uniref:hypothetical protein n=1 Tax=unclassified Brevibacterium TaxID=2614124 RepID=UPI0010930F8F|nr:hypothetical protein [Brevibacterium sp. S22]TGD30597.1 hypothetical protein EB835_11725 [Brevibacterium sp. S22]
MSQPDHEGAAIDLDLPTHSSGAFEFDKGPSTSVITDEETIKAVLPDVVETGQKPSPTTMMIISIGSGSEDNIIPKGRFLTSAGFDMEGLRSADCNASDPRRLH